MSFRIEGYEGQKQIKSVGLPKPRATFLFISKKGLYSCFHIWIVSYLSHLLLRTMSAKSKIPKLPQFQHKEKDKDKEKQKEKDQAVQDIPKSNKGQKGRKTDTAKQKKDEQKRKKKKEENEKKEREKKEAEKKEAEKKEAEKKEQERKEKEKQEKEKLLLEELAKKNPQEIPKLKEIEVEEVEEEEEEEEEVQVEAERKTQVGDD